MLYCDRLILMFTKYNEITQCNDHYAVQVIDFGTDRELIYEFLLVINLLSCTVSKLRLVKFSLARVSA